MNDSHKSFFQVIANLGVMNASQVKELFSLCTRTPDQVSVPGTQNEDLREFIRVINRYVGQYLLQIKKGVCEVTGKHFFVLINKIEEDFLQHHSGYTEAQYNVLKKTIDLIVSSGCGFTTLEECESKLSDRKHDTEDTIDMFTRHQFLAQDNEKIYLGVRTLLEMDHYLREAYPDDIKSCAACSNLCIFGRTCAHCESRLHKHCADIYFVRQKSKQCPSCEHNFTE